MTTNPAMPSILFVGLRREEPEWRAELSAADQLGYVAHVAAESSLAHTGLPEHRTSKFTLSDNAEDDANSIRGTIHFAPALVTCWGDRMVERSAHLAEGFGLRGPGVEAARACTDKRAQRLLLEPHELNPRWRSGNSLAELESAVGQLGTTAIFKLAHSSGGRGLAVLNGRASLEETLQATKLNYCKSDAFVVEEYVEGTEHSVAGLVLGGEPYVYAVADKGLRAGTFVTETTIVPSALTPAQEDAVRAAAVRAVRAVGIRDGGFHVDIRLGSRGPIVLEVGARLGGDLINSDLVPIATRQSFQPYREVLQLLGAGKVPGEAKYTSVAAMLVLVGGAGAAEKAAEHPRVRAVTDWSTPGAARIAVVVEAEEHGLVPAIAKELREGLRDR